MQDKNHEAGSPAGADEARRGFLATCGRFAIITPPAVTMLLSTSLTSRAIAKSGGVTAKGNNGYGNGGNDGTNPGSNQGGGVSQGGPGAGQSQSGSKGPDKIR
jgi:hypothetical protein